jgi:glucan phosphoethanolaminetransferase (alkaline phosphatase superfamily)
VCSEGIFLRRWFNFLLRLAAGAYFALTSVYCLLAFLPYTYCGFIKTPPYAWMPWFAGHQPLTFWIAFAALTAANWRRGSWSSKNQSSKNKWLLAGLAMGATAGFYLTFRPFLPGLQDNQAAYELSLISLIPLAAVFLWREREAGPQESVASPNIASPSVASQKHVPEPQLFAYSTGALTALAISVIYFVGAKLQIQSESGSFNFHGADILIVAWSVITHAAVGLLVLSAINLIYLLAAKLPKPQTARRLLVGVLIASALWTVLARFLNNAMSFGGWPAQVYAVAFAAALTLWGFSLVDTRPVKSASRSLPQTVAICVAVAALVAFALTARRLIGGEDWNGFVEGTVALILWAGLSFGLYRLRPSRTSYSTAILLTILLATAGVYKTLQATEIFWGKALGSTDDEIAIKLEDYAGHDASFQLAHHAMGNGRSEACGDLCRIMREYTNIRDTHVRNGVQLVEKLAPGNGERPNIFIFVIDSMRPDYLGAYNQRVDYTPNLDELARDSAVFTNVYTQYAGTSLSEPAIWAGAELLHTHFPEPFEKVDSLLALARADRYRVVASEDEMLSQVLTPADNVTLLDQDKKLWNQLEICSTIEQSERYLDGHAGDPILLYTQPKNVHQFARNDVPSPTSQHWPARAGMNSRITYEIHWVDSCLGGFFSYLKHKGMYDNSIIIVTSDHGDATGEFGRISHSTSIWPEIMRVPLIVHLPPKMRKGAVYETERLSTLTDIMPSLFYLLGHKPIARNPLYGRPLFAESQQELASHPRGDIFLASDVRAVYGILSGDGRYLYTTYDSPAQSYLFDLLNDPHAQHDILTPAAKQRYDEEIIEHLHAIGDYYGYRPGVGSLLASAGR